MCFLTLCASVGNKRVLYSLITSLIQAAYPLHCTPLNNTLYSVQIYITWILMSY